MSKIRCCAVAPIVLLALFAASSLAGKTGKVSVNGRRMLLANVPAFQLDYNSRRPPFTCDDARRIAIPVLVLSGDRSAMGLQRIAEAAARCINGARFVSIPQATHWMQHDQAEAFNDAALAFLSRNGK